MVKVSVQSADELWFGMAFEGGALVATATGSSSEDALEWVCRSIRTGIAYEVIKDPSDFVDETARMLAELERGIEEKKHFILSDKLPDSLRKVLYAAASIPIGSVSTYGNIAKAAGSEARAVGRVMATNPLYPIVPCHRVVGANMNLVGYQGRQDGEALELKLDRLRTEGRGFTSQGLADVLVLGITLPIYPVEWAIAEGRRGKPGSVRADEGQLALFD